MPIPELADLQQALRGRDDQNAIRRHLIAITDLLQAIIVRADQRLDTLEAKVPIGDARLDTLEGQAAAGATRLTALEAVPAVTMTVVANLGALPANASPTSFFRVQGNANVFIGNGPGQPLTKLVPA